MAKGPGGTKTAVQKENPDVFGFSAAVRFYLATECTE
jgi:hypothetical protein